jgi:hypothetical protein
MNVVILILFLLAGAASGFFMIKKMQRGNDCSFFEYTGLISQIDGSDPVVDINENTIGLIKWNTAMAGIFYGSLDGAFPDKKTHVWIGENGSNETTFRANRNTTNNIVISTKENGKHKNGLMFQTPIRIIVYK